ncbi:MAG: HAD hydrolase-like protein [Nostocaceae cyanobacterium]|nr:HAD hydrolase-like protein [Nostocaceae cyanobacterium]
MAINPSILALDFDGVICDGLIEYFQVAWRTYCQVWQPVNNIAPESLANQFYPLRAVIETGWEMPVLIRALIREIPAENIYREWGTIVKQILQEEDLQPAEIGAKLDKNRDEWIGNDLDGWLSLHRFYPGVVEKIQATLKSDIPLYIITTKEGRFVQKLLQQSGVDFGREAIFGKEVKRPKYEILRELIQSHQVSPKTVWFVEDRLKTLQVVDKQADLEEVKLYLADWGYNTTLERENAQKDPRIQLISLPKFAQDFSMWK